MNNIIDVDRLCKSFNNKVVINNLSFTVEESSIFALLGNNGVGKTTTLDIITGYLPQDSGKINILGYDPHKTPYEILYRDIGFALQDMTDYGNLSVREILNYFIKIYGVDRSYTIKELLEIVILEKYEKRLIHTLSGGERHRLDIALALCGKPKVLFMDEPTTGLDPYARFAFLQTIQELNKSGLTVVLTSHYLDEIEKIATHIGILLPDHQLIFGTKDEVINKICNNRSYYITWFNIKEKKQYNKYVDNASIWLKDFVKDNNIDNIDNLEIKKVSLESLYLDLINK